MKLQLVKYLACAACGFALSTPLPLRAADPVAEPLKALDEDWREPLERFRDFVVELSLGHMEEAWQKYRVMAPFPPKSPQTPFEPDPYELFTKGIGRFPSDVESLSIIGERRFTPNARKFTLICDTRIGPVVVEILIFRSRGEWFFGQLGYKAVSVAETEWLRQFDDLLPATRYPTPVDLPLPKRETPTEAAAQ